MKQEGQKAEKADGNTGKRDQTRGQMVTRGKNKKNGTWTNNWLQNVIFKNEYKISIKE